MNRVVRLLIGWYLMALRSYPQEIEETFGDEMQTIFLEGAEEARAQNKFGKYLLRELRDTPKSLAKAYWYSWRMKFQRGLDTLREAASTSDLPPPTPDGRESWMQVVLELSLFLAAGYLLIWVTYFPFEGLRPGWQRDLGFLGRVIVPLTLPVLLLGLTRGLPRWAYPFGGLLLSYQLFVTYLSGMWFFLIAIALSFVALAIVEIITNPQTSLLPLRLRRIGQSLSLDWTRLSFGLFGAMPLVIILAFDDSYTDSRTPYLAFSVLGMAACALIYCRSRERTMQVTALMAGLTVLVCGAWLDKIYFVSGLNDWVIVPAAGIEEFLWLLKLWIQWGLLILSPVLLIIMGRAVRVRRAV